MSERRKPFRNEDGSWSVPLTRGKVAIVDDQDVKAVAAHNWNAYPSGQTWYAQRSYWTGERVATEGMGRFLTSPPKGLVVDHINGNGLDNRRSNLRHCTRQQNRYNTPTRRESRSGYTGVKKRANGRFTTYLKGKSYGTYDTPEEAARAYDLAAIDEYGEFARTNF